MQVAEWDMPNESTWGSLWWPRIIIV